MKKKTAILSLTFACALAFGASSMPTDNRMAQNDVLATLDKLESYATTTYDWENPSSMLLNDDYSLFYSNGNYSVGSRDYMFFGSFFYPNHFIENGYRTNYSNNNYSQNIEFERNYQNNNSTSNNTTSQNAQNNTTSTNYQSQNNGNYAQNTNSNQRRILDMPNPFAPKSNQTPQTQPNEFKGTVYNVTTGQTSKGTSQSSPAQTQNSSNVMQMQNANTQNAGSSTTNQTPNAQTRTNQSSTNSQMMQTQSGSNLAQEQNNVYNQNAGSSTATKNMNTQTNTNQNTMSNQTSQNTTSNSSTNQTNNSQPISKVQSNSGLILSNPTDYSTSLTTTGTELKSNISTLKNTLGQTDLTLSQTQNRALTAYGYTLKNITKKLEMGNNELMNSANKLSILKNNTSAENTALDACNLDIKASLASKWALLECANEAVTSLNEILNSQNQDETTAENTTNTTPNSSTLNSNNTQNYNTTSKNSSNATSQATSNQNMSTSNSRQTMQNNSTQNTPLFIMTFAEPEVETQIIKEETPLRPNKPEKVTPKHPHSNFLDKQSKTQNFDDKLAD